MGSTGAEVSTSLGLLNGVHRFSFNPRGTLNSSKRLVVRFNGVRPSDCVRDRIVLKRWVP
jgi:hypothetical protein